ncbi:Bromodomain-containing protein [Calocera cornea HHB12733]|uniref:Bromodomain-containing protein n=1 Tax=Calocera cornea HHB12733 TaxID=1353952 RepID=A0A165GTD8_9BASI|nr:Bromodomain-containing protein [Calocera cornea HHB12733]
MDANSTPASAVLPAPVPELPPAPQQVNGVLPPVDGQQYPSASPLPPPQAEAAEPAPTITEPTPAAPEPTPAVPEPAPHTAPELHVPLPSFNSSLDRASVVPQLDTPQDPASIPIHAPRGTPPPPVGQLLADVQIAEEADAPVSVAEVVDEVPVPPEAVLPPAQLLEPVAEPVVEPAPVHAPVQTLAPAPVASVAQPISEGVTPAVEQLRDLSVSPVKKRTAEEMEDDLDQVPRGFTVISPMDEMDVETPKQESTPTVTDDVSMDGPTQLSTSDSLMTVGRQENGEPPVKRQRLTPTPDLRIHTNGLNHSRVSTFSAAQHRLATASLRQLKKSRDASPFLKPVDTVGLNIPQYNTIIKHPMDLGTIEEKLLMSNPAIKPGTKQYSQMVEISELAPDKRYWSADEFMADVRLVFDNAFKFNGEVHVVGQMARRLLGIFDKQMEKMPAAEEPKPVMPIAQSAPIMPSVPSPPLVQQQPAVHPAPPKQQRRQSIAVPVIRRNSPETPTAVVRPKREIHPPPPKDLPYAEPTLGKKKRSGKGKGRERDDGTQEQLRFCAQVIQHLYKKQFYTAAYAFYDPVDHVALNIPDYPKIVKKPMDLSTMKKKLENQEYENAQEFYADFKLMIKNCRLYNPAGSPVRHAGDELSHIFDEKWKGLPPIVEPEDDEDEEEEEEEEIDDTDAAMAGVEAQVAKLVKTLEMMKKQKAEKQVKKKPSTPKEESKPKATKPRKPKPAPAAAGTPTAGPSKPRKKKDKDEESDEDGPVDFFKKRELAEEIPKLEGEALTDALAVIQEGMAQDNPMGADEEIELDIDILAPSVIRKLYRMVVEPAKKKREAEEKRKMRASGAAVGGGRAGGNAGKGASGRKGHPTGGLKRKSMDEAAEAEKIRMLEARLSMFNGGGAGDVSATSQPQQQVMMDVDESVSTEDESSSDDDDSGSE